MKLWSKGLGRTEVTMDFRHYKVVKDPETKGVAIVGNMQDPVTWEFRILMQPEDVAGFMKMFFSFSMFLFVLRNLFQYFVYLFNRKKYMAPDHDKLEDKIMASYENVMNRSRRRRGGAQKARPASDSA